MKKIVISEQKLRSLIQEAILSERDEMDAAASTMTAGELRRALRNARGKNVMTIGGEVAKKAGLYGLKAALGTLPGGGTISAALEAGLDIADIIGKARNLKPREKKSSPLWDVLSIDPDVSDVVHDAVEDRFIDSYAASIESLPDDAPLPDADRAFTKWLEREYNGVQVAKVRRDENI